MRVHAKDSGMSLRAHMTVMGAAALVAVGLLGTTRASTWNVSPTSTGACTGSDPNCNTIQAAINAASEGDVINVYPGIYSETASVPSPPACPGNTVGLYIATNGLTIQGVDESGTPIVDPSLVAATVNTNSNLCFGPDGFFVTGDNVTIAGIRVGTNTGDQNKTIEVVGDNFTLKDCDLADPKGSVYIDDFRFDDVNNLSHVQSYRIENNIFEDQVSLDLANGAGFSGPVSGRVITGNRFNNLATAPGTRATISFNGADTGVPWFLYSVGGAVITGNTFSNSAPDGQHIRARGTYDNSQFDWATYWGANTYNKAAIVGSSPPSVVETYSYPNSYGTFNDVRRIGATIQGEVTHAQAGDTVLVGAGVYPEQISITKNGITVNGAGAGSRVQPATVVSDTTQGSPCSNGSGTAVVLVSGATGVTLNNLNVDGSLVASAMPARFIGIYYRNASGAINGGSVTGIRNGQQNAVGILVQANGANVATVNTTGVTVSGYEKNGITYNGCGCSDNIDGVATGMVTGCTITGDGPTGLLAQNGVQVGFGAGPVTVQGNSISGNYYTGNTANGNGADGILFFSASNNTAMGNLIDGSNNGVEMAFNQFALCPTGASSGNTVRCNRISNNDVGVLSLAAANVVNQNLIDGNAVGIDGSGVPPGPALDATQNYWGCATGAGTAGCDTVVGNVQAVPFASAAPACTYCNSDGDCDDGLFCNGLEKCNLGSNRCETEPGTVIGCSSLNNSCNAGTCEEPGQCVASPQPDGTPCNTGDTCQAGVCTGTNSLTVGAARLRRNTSESRNNGFLSVRMLVNDNDTGGMLAANLLGGTVTLEVMDAGQFHSTITFTNCQVNAATGRVSCRDRSTGTTAKFIRQRLPFRGSYTLIYSVRVRRSGLGTSDTGSVQPSGPVQVILHQGPQSLVDRPGGIDSDHCEPSGKSALYCRS